MFIKLAASEIASVHIFIANKLFLLPLTIRYWETIQQVVLHHWHGGWKNHRKSWCSTCYLQYKDQIFNNQKLYFSCEIVLGKFSRIPEEEFPILETMVPKWTRLLDQAVHQPYQPLFQWNSRDRSDESSNGLFPFPLMQSLSFLCTSLWLQKV